MTKLRSRVGRALTGAVRGLFGAPPDTRPEGAPTKVIFLNSHPIQYFVPLYQELAKRPDVDLTVLYGSAHGLQGELDRQFGVQVRWDVPMLDGYASVFLPNLARNPSIYGFFGLVNPAVITHLARAPRGLVVVHGWAYATHWMALVAAKATGHTVCLRAESPLSHEGGRGRVAEALRDVRFRRVLFPLVDRMLYIGRQNRAFYRHFGVEDSRLFFAPYAVDNERFTKAAAALGASKAELRASLGLPADRTVILSSGKYIDKKRPLDLLRAFQRCAHRARGYVVFMGEGALRAEMERFIRDHDLADCVRLTGFVNQSKVGEYYAASDVFTMCSEVGETWGLSTNEAMNFRLPIVLSHLTGCSDDLVVEGENGHVFETGNVDDYAAKLDAMLVLSRARLAEMGAASARRIAGYGYAQVIEGLLAAADRSAT